MTRIVSAEAYLVNLPVLARRTDAVQSFIKQETIFVSVTTDEGLRGVGYSYTIGTGGSAVLALLRDHLCPLLPGRDPAAVESVWNDLFASTRATTVGPVTSLALAAVDIALWDLRCLRAGEPLWRLAGGYRNRVPLYDTEGGWLHLSTDELVASARQSQERGWPAVKLKIGKPRQAEDVERLRAVREAVGESLDLMVDANQAFTLADALRRADALADLRLTWLEEPLPADDVEGHRLLARSSRIPIAVGESLYSLSQFQQYLARGAASVVQVDVARVGGITPWLKVAHLAEAFHVEVCPHFLMELHVSLAAAVPNGRYVEHIPQLQPITSRQITIVDGYAIAPEEPGIGIAWDEDSIDNLRVA